MSYTILSRLKTSDITNIIGEFNQSIRVFDEKRYKEARKNGSLHYYNHLRLLCDKERDYKELRRKRLVIRKRPITLLKRIKYWYRLKFYFLSTCLTGRAFINSACLFVIIKKIVESPPTVASV